ncbi:hypothetical protein C8034_v012052 [Colletotrichum sidae]|uniref:CCHC-type domain-containing protein n=1 Tax=Colletotrichum sidae TaxID=1347389 RepID=A0A4R8TIW4_9PEZI|nr:hypothetical protein C8034_v012052 [Colletotrichum sidae]
MPEKTSESKKTEQNSGGEVVRDVTLDANQCKRCQSRNHITKNCNVPSSYECSKCCGTHYASDCPNVHTTKYSQ